MKEDPKENRGFSTTQAAQYTSVSKSFFEKARIGATETPGPSFIKVGRRVVYRREDLDNWLNQFAES
jgi:excisionase family DNA binding protein